MLKALGRTLLPYVVVIGLASPIPANAVPTTTQPAPLAQRVERLLDRLDSDRFSDRQAAAGELDLLPVEALPLLEAAIRRAGVSPELRTSLTRPIARLRQAARKQARYREHLEFFRGQYAGEYQRVGQKDPAWDGAADRLLEEAARFSAAQLTYRHIGPGVTDAADAVRKLKPADPLLRHLAMQFDHPRALRPLMDLWPAMEASQYSPFRKAVLAATIVSVAGENPSPAKKDQGAKPYLAHAADHFAQCLRDEKFPAAVAIQHLQYLLFNGHNAGVDRKEAFDLIDTRLATVLGEEHLVRLNVRGYHLAALANDQRNGQAGELNWEQSTKTFEQAEKVLQRAYELYPDDRHAPLTMLDVVIAQSRGPQTLDLWFDRVLHADPENYTAYEKKLNALDPEDLGGDGEYLAFARRCLASGHFETRIPLMVVQAHRSSEEPAPWASLVPKPYYAQDDVWADLAAAYEGFLRHNPDAHDDRADYAELAWQAGKWRLAAEQYRLLASAPGWDQRNVGHVRLIQLELPVRLAEAHPRPDLAGLAEKRDREDAAELRRLMVDHYEAFGRKSPKWDEPARLTLAAIARQWSTDPARTGGENDAILKFGRSALDAGCDDPLVRFAYQWTLDSFVTPHKPQAKFPSFADAVALRASAYPEVIKAMALSGVIYARLSLAKPTDAERAECLKELDAVIPLLETAAREHQTRHEYLAGTGTYLFNSVYLAGGDLRAYYDRLRVALERARCEPFALKELHACYLWQHAIATVPPGSGQIPPTPDQLTEYRQRTAVAEAACERLWQERPDRRGAIWALVQIAGCADEDAAKTAFWVRQAALADPQHRPVAEIAVATYLREGELEPLARAASETGAWRTQLPFMLVDHHVKFASLTEPGEDPADLPDVHKIAEEDVWQDIANVYEGYLARYPDDSDRRSEYASLACRAGRWLIAMDQMKLLGDRVRPKAFVTTERLEACRKKIAGFQAITSQPATP